MLSTRSCWLVHLQLEDENSGFLEATLMINFTGWPTSTAPRKIACVNGKLLPISETCTYNSNRLSKTDAEQIDSLP